MRCENAAFIEGAASGEFICGAESSITILQHCQRALMDGTDPLNHLLACMRRSVTAANDVASNDPITTQLLRILKTSVLPSFQTRLVFFVLMREWPLAVYNVRRGRRRNIYVNNMLEFLAYLDQWLLVYGRDVDMDRWKMMHDFIAHMMEASV